MPTGSLHESQSLFLAMIWLEHGRMKSCHPRIPHHAEPDLEPQQRHVTSVQGIEGHRSSLTKFAELLLLHGAINTQQLAIALELVDLVFDQGGARRVRVSVRVRVGSGSGSGLGLGLGSGLGLVSSGHHAAYGTWLSSPTFIRTRETPVATVLRSADPASSGPLTRVGHAGSRRVDACRVEWLLVQWAG